MTRFFGCWNQWRHPCVEGTLGIQDMASSIPSFKNNSCSQFPKLAAHFSNEPSRWRNCSTFNPEIKAYGGSNVGVYEHFFRRSLDFSSPLVTRNPIQPNRGLLQNHNQGIVGCTPGPTYHVMGNSYISPIARGYLWVVILTFSAISFLAPNCVHQKESCFLGKK